MQVRLARQVSMISTKIFDYISGEDLNELFDSCPIYGVTED